MSTTLSRAFTRERHQRLSAHVAKVVVSVVVVTSGAVNVNSTPAYAAATFPTMNDSGGIYWRLAPNWANAETVPGYGFYPGTYVNVSCYQSGSNVPGSANTMWVQASWASGPGRGSGWMNEHFVNDGAPIDQAAPGIPPCSSPAQPPPVQQPPPVVTTSAPPPSTIVISGTVICNGAEPVTGVWVSAAGGGWASWAAIDKEDYPSGAMAYYWSAVTAPTTVSLHIGCGGNPANWRTQNYTPTTIPLTSSQPLDTYCNEALGPGAVRCAALSVPSIGNRVADLALNYDNRWGGLACEAAHLGASGYVGGYSGGQCRQFVNCLVYRASWHTFNPTSPDYSFTGAFSVSAASAGRGDIIQKGAGGHTAVILANLGNGVFRVVDSNYHLNEVVSVHTWAPGTAAVSYWRYSQPSTDQSGQP